MLSRVAENLFWMSRYVERAENVARLVDVNLQLFIDEKLPVREQWEPLVATLGDQEAFRERGRRTSVREVLAFLTADPAYSNSIAGSLQRARENARAVREQITTEMWSCLNDLHLRVAAEIGRKRWLEAPHALYDAIKTQCQLFQGATDATMSHDEGWNFIQAGKFLERAEKTARIVDVKYHILLPSPGDVGSPLDFVQWVAVLKSCSGFEPFCRKHTLQFQIHPIIDFLLRDPVFPRSTAYCLHRVQESLHRISGVPVGRYSDGAERKIGQARALVDYRPATEILKKGLHEFLENVQEVCNEVGDEIHRRYFAMAPDLEVPEGGTAVRVRGAD